MRSTVSITLREKYAKDYDDTQREIPLLRQLTQRTFDKEQELTELKAELKRLEKQISDNIAKKAEGTETKEATMVTLDHSENTRLSVSS
jgi:cell shape-determining protein MreC